MDKFKLALQGLHPKAIIVEQFPYYTTVMDYAVIIKDYLYEIALVTSKNDYLADFGKIVKAGRNSFNKHAALNTGNFVDNRFYFMIPSRMISSKEIPTYAGLITYKEEKGVIKLKVLKEAPLLHSMYLKKYFYTTLSKHLLAQTETLKSLLNLNNNGKALHPPINATNPRKSNPGRRNILPNTGKPTPATRPQKKKKA